jgi:hypothetical protein
MLDQIRPHGLAIYMQDLSPQQRLHIVTNIKSNDQLLSSNTLRALLDNIRSSKDMLDEEFDKLLSDNGLEKYVRNNVKDLDEDIPF